MDAMQRKLDMFGGGMKKYFIMLGAFLASAFFAGCGSDACCVQKTDTAMGTVITEKLYVEGKNADEVGAEAAEDILALLREDEEEILSRRVEGSEISLVNAASEEAEEGIVTVELGERLAEIFSRSVEMSEASAGAFDVTLGRLISLWDIDSYANGEKEDFLIPSDDEIEEALSSSGYRQISLEGNVLQFSAGMQFDLGGVGKGVGLDDIREFLENTEGITGAIISAGGSVLTYGEKTDGTAWKVGIVDPFDTSQSIGTLSLSGSWTVTTSGDYERYVEVDGVRYHHLLDPTTGFPARSGIKSVTILTQDGFLGDALSTACFVLGEEKGLALVESYAAMALFVREDGSVVMSEGMENYFSE